MTIRHTVSNQNKTGKTLHKHNARQNKPLLHNNPEIRQVIISLEYIRFPNQEKCNIVPKLISIALLIKPLIHGQVIP